MEGHASITINTRTDSLEEYRNELRKAILFALKRLFFHVPPGQAIEFREEETTAIYYLLELVERLE